MNAEPEALVQCTVDDVITRRRQSGLVKTAIERSAREKKISLKRPRTNWEDVIKK